MRRAPAALAVLVALGLGAAACGGDPSQARRATGTTDTVAQSRPTATVTQPTSPLVTADTSVTAAATNGAPPCGTGTTTVKVAVDLQPPPVCVTVGSTLKVIFDKSKAQIGAPGPWSIPAVQADPPHLLRVRSTKKAGPIMVATLKAVRPGTPTVTAGFGQECTGPQSTPCTIPPQAILSVPVTVVAAPSP